MPQNRSDGCNLGEGFARKSCRPCKCRYQDHDSCGVGLGFRTRGERGTFDRDLARIDTLSRDILEEIRTVLGEVRFATSRV
jgi:hypothetical protein